MSANQIAHVSDERFLELGLGMSLTREEDAHVATCAACATRIAEENELSSLLGMVDETEAPAQTSAADFVMQTVVRYERTRTTAEAVRMGVVLAMTMVIGAFVSMIGSVVLAPRIPHLLGNLLHAGIAAAKLANAGSVLASSAPWVAAGVMMMATLTVTLLAATLLRLYSRHTRVLAATSPAK